MDINKKTKKNLPKFNFYWVYLAIALVLIAFSFWPMSTSTSEVPYSQFEKALSKGSVEKVNVNLSKQIATATIDAKCYKEITGKTLKSGKEIEIYTIYPSIESFTETVNDLKAQNKFTGEVKYNEGRDYLSLFLYSVLPLVLLIGFFIFMNRKMMGGGSGGPGGVFNVGKSKAQMFDKNSVKDKVTFADVAGLEGAKQEIEEIVNFLKNPKRYTTLGGKIPKGALLVGPPGTGKTLLAKAVAGEANVPFFSMSGSDFVEMFVGVGASRVRDLFRQAKEKAPCIVFIDEIDAIGQKRNSGAMGGNDEREQTLNQLLTEMDGFEGNNGVIILAATNRPESLDAALTRPGRFDRRVPVELPDLKGREEILKVHAKKIKVSEDVDYSKIARMASGASGAELANIVNEAALRAVRDNRKFATQADLEESIEVVIAGYQKKNAILTDHEKLVVSYHEIGHALVAAKQTNSAPVQKITIVPRTSGALGYTMQVEEGNHYLMTKEELENKIATYTGGRAAEEIVFQSISTGASNDIEQATKIARSMLTRYGMSEDFDMVALETVSNQYLGGDASLACSAQMQAKIDDQVIELVKKLHGKAKQILIENREKLDELAKFLYEKETITGDEFMSILNS